MAEAYGEGHSVCAHSTIPDVVNLPQHFKNNGYYTNAIGKIYHNTMPDSISWSEDKLHVDGYPFDPDATYVGERALEDLGKRKKEIVETGNMERYIDWCKMTKYRVDTRVPLIFSTPALRDNPVVCDELVEFIDIYPTLFNIFCKLTS